MYTFFPSFLQLKIHIHTFNVHLCIFYIYTDFQNVDVVDDDEKIIIKKMFVYLRISYTAKQNSEMKCKQKQQHKYTL